MQLLGSSSGAKGPNMSVLGPDRIEGWKAIAAAVGVSVTRVRELADPKRKFQLPVRYGARGVYVARVALEGWFAQYDAPYGAHDQLKRRESVGGS